MRDLRVEGITSKCVLQVLHDTDRTGLSLGPNDELRLIQK
jgi:hypothetical protein